MVSGEVFIKEMGNELIASKDIVFDESSVEARLQDKNITKEKDECNFDERENSTSARIPKSFQGPPDSFMPFGYLLRSKKEFKALFKNNKTKVKSDRLGRLKYLMRNRLRSFLGGCLGDGCVYACIVPWSYWFEPNEPKC